MVTYSTFLNLQNGIRKYLNLKHTIIHIRNSYETEIKKYYEIENPRQCNIFKPYKNNTNH